MIEAIPPELELVRAFVNTLDVEAADDELGSPEGLRRFLVERALIDEDVQPDSHDLEAAIELRESLRAMLRAHHGDPVEEASVRRLTALAGRFPLQVRFRPGDDAILLPLKGGVAGALGRILADVAVAMTKGSWERLKVCSEDSCQWAFYDRSKNRSGRWCSMRVCGNRTKTRAYRDRRRGART